MTQKTATRIKSFLLIFLSFNLYATEHQHRNLNTFLKEFHQNTKEVINQLPYKKFTQGNLPFLDGQIESKDFVQAKDQLRQSFCKEYHGSKICLDELEGRSKIEANDRAALLVENGNRLISNLGEMDQAELHKKAVPVQPWSDDYWPIYAGVLGKRYADSERIYTSNWQEAHNYVEEKPIDHYLQNNLTDFLSPSEKYDLLVGDKDGSLTKEMWHEGEVYFFRDSKVETWMGICHGWAPASFMLDRPTQKVSVLAADGITVINFYPSDIKGLSSLLWANAQVPSKFVGSRCNNKAPELDSENGRIIDTKCFDTNPGTWHESIVNQIGVSKRAFVMDATFDYEVWNQPVISYEYSYFNVKTAAVFSTWDEAAIKLKKYENDKFKKYRSEESRYVVGVQMTVVYLSETSPDHSEFDSAERDSTREVTYRYDLEVDNYGNILGGEWYTNAHPDFMWTPAISARATTRADAYLSEVWKSEKISGVYKGIPKAWTPYAVQASGYSLPLASVVEGLIKRSNEVTK